MSIGHIRTVYDCNVWAKELRDHGITCEIINDGRVACDNGPYVFVPAMKPLPTNTEHPATACVVSDDCVERVLLCLAQR